MCNSTPLSPTTMEETAMTAGPVRKRTAIAKEATVFPHAMIRGCNAMNNPTNQPRNSNLQTLNTQISPQNQSKTCVD